MKKLGLLAAVLVTIAVASSALAQDRDGGERGYPSDRDHRAMHHRYRTNRFEDDWTGNSRWMVSGRSWRAREEWREREQRAKRHRREERREHRRSW